MLAPTGEEFGFAEQSSMFSSLYIAQVFSATDLDHPLALAAMGTPVGPPRIQMWEQLHRIFGHAHQAAVEWFVQENPKESSVDKASQKDYFCRACVEGKMHVAPFPQEVDNDMQQVRDLVVMDIWGPSQVESLQWNRYYVSFVDIYSRLSVVYFMWTKDQVKDYYKIFKVLVQTQTGWTIKQVRSDNGKEYINKDLNVYTMEQGTLLEQTSPYSSSQNRITEQLNWMLADFSRAGMVQHGLLMYLWQESIALANLVRNWLPTRATGRTLYEMFYGRKAPLQYMEEFGAEIWVLDQSGMVRKLDWRANKYQFMGFSEVSRGFRYYKPESRQVLVSQNVVFELVEKQSEGDTDSDNEGSELDEAELPAEGGDSSESDSEQEELSSTKSEDVKKEGQPPAQQKW
jgi:hypothetical protein